MSYELTKCQEEVLDLRSRLAAAEQELSAMERVAEERRNRAKAAEQAVEEARAFAVFIRKYTTNDAWRERVNVWLSRHAPKAQEAKKKEAPHD